MIKTPSFWYDSKQPSWLEMALAPLGKVYSAGAQLYALAKTPKKVSIPVICVGNLTAGGSGKTPIALTLMQMIIDQGLFQNPYFLSRGYGGLVRGPTVFDPSRHSYKDVGDEVFLLGKIAPCIVARNRHQGAMLAQSRGADIIIMDDGLQNYDLAQDLKIVVIDGAMGFGNGKTIPAGPLREDLKTGLAKADAFVVVGEDARGVLPLLPSGNPVLKAQVKSVLSEHGNFVAFAGLGWPDKFFASLQAAGVNLVEKIPFPDHHPYTADDMDELLERAKKAHARLVTTRKDMIRIPSFYARNPDIIVAGLHINWDDPSAALQILQSAS